MTVKFSDYRLSAFGICVLTLFLIFGAVVAKGIVTGSETAELGPSPVQDECEGYNQALVEAADALERRFDVLEATRLRNLRRPCSVNTATVYRTAR